MNTLLQWHAPHNISFQSLDFLIYGLRNAVYNKLAICLVFSNRLQNKKIQIIRKYAYIDYQKIVFRHDLCVSRIIRYDNEIT